MTTRANLLLATIFGLGLVILARVLLAAPVPHALDDSMQFLPVENADIFSVMGANVWKIRVPASQLADKSTISLKVKLPDNTTKVVAAKLRDKRNKTDPLDVTVVIQFDDIEYTACKRVNLALLSNEFSARSVIGRPMPKITGFERPNDTGDLRKGLVLANLTATNENSGQVEAKTTFMLVNE